jgi:hypothetical protein
MKEKKISVLKKFTSTAKIVILALFLSLGAGVIFAQWTNPPGPFPAGQPPAPVNVGSDSQTKAGPFWAGLLGSEGSLYISTNAEIVGDTLIGGSITIGGGNPAPGKLLSSTDDQGLGVWIDPPSISCVRRSNIVTLGTEATSACLPGEVVTGGGGECDETEKYIVSSKPSLDLSSWTLECSGGGFISSYVVCCSI